MTQALEPRAIVGADRAPGNVRENRVAICAAHHPHGVHGGGYVRAWGSAPDGVHWEPGTLRADVEALLHELGVPIGRDVFLMPRGTRAEELAERGRWLAELCATRGYRFTPRLHDLWGDVRGR